MTSGERCLLDEKYAGEITASFADDCVRLANNEPLAYVIGWQPFLGLKIRLDSHPLIPRSETEWWTEQLLKEIAYGNLTDSRLNCVDRCIVLDVKPIRKPMFRFLDLCAGSGAIGCAALAFLPNAHVFFGEVDTTHESTIHANIIENKLDASRATICIGDVFNPFENLYFDVIAINPPYIPSGRVLPKSIINYEPAEALFAGKDGLDIIRCIASALPKHLSEKGVAWIECDESNVIAARGLFEQIGFRSVIHNDQYSLPRIVVLCWQ